MDNSTVPTPRNAPKSAESVLEALNRAELTQQMEARRKAARRHGLWAVLGLSPAAFVPLILMAHELGIAIAAGCTFFVSGVEAWRAFQAHMDAKECEAALRETGRSRICDGQQKGKDVG
jgi:hypothetical protein